MKRILLLLTLLFTVSTAVQAQLAEVDFSQRIQQSATIVEGEVISQFSFWDDNQHNIYTASTIEVFKLFKGNGAPQYVEVITPGGIVGLHKETVEPSLELKVGSLGVFMLKANQVPSNSTTFNSPLQYQPVAGPQAFIAYDYETGTAHDVFQHYHNVTQNVHAVIASQTMQRASKLKKYDFEDEAAAFQAKGGTSITNFTPTTVTAGTETILTINGSGFGASPGSVEFRNADDGGATFVTGLATEIISWNDTQIQVEVYQEAGTGVIRVNGTGTATSAQTLTVSWAHLNPEFDEGNGLESYMVQHVDRNGTGGYIWRMHTDFDAGPGNATFLRSLETWRCSSGIHWTIGATTTTDVSANDDINIIRHDNGGELPGGVLGRCTSRWSGCGGGPILWYVEELDIVFDDGTNWNYTTSAPGPTQYDFESVATHELGHGHQLGHVINTNEVMHYAISNGEQQRSLSPNDIAGSNDVQSRSTSGGRCGESAMTNYSCGAAPVAEFSGTPTTICEGASVSFTDMSTNTPTSWLWDFGDSQTSTQQNPSHSYSSAGTYTVTLTATNASGSDDEVKTNYITVNANPNVSNTSSTAETCVGNDGTASVFPTGGSGNYTYLWFDPLLQTTQTAVGLTANNYNVNVTDAVTGCSSATVVTVSDGCSPVPSTQLRVGYCGNTLAALNTYLKCYPVSGADLYEFRIVNSGIGYDETINGLTNPILTALTFAPNVQYATTYDVTVRARVSGQWGNFGPVCAVTTPGVTIPTTSLRAGYCGTTVSAPNTTLKCYAVAGASNYEFRFVHAGSGYDETVFGSSNNPLLTSFAQLANPPAASTTYDVTVRAQVAGQWGNFGSVCQVTTPANMFTSSGHDNAFADFIPPEELVDEGGETSLLIYPNPNNGDELGVRISNIGVGIHNTQIELFDLFGKRVYATRETIVGTEINTILRFNGELATGMYIVRVLVGETAIQQKLTIR